MREGMSPGWSGARCLRPSRAVSIIAVGGSTEPPGLMYDDMTGRNFELYLAVATLDPATQPNRTGGLAPDLKGALQIWTVSPGSGINETGLREEFFDAANDADMKCSLVLCIEGGPIIDFKWMPVGCCDEVSLSEGNSFGYVTEFYITGRV